MKKKLFFAALASIVLVGCTSNDFVGDTPPAVNGSGQAIGFGGGAGRITRATTTDPTAADHDKLDNQFLIYGVKTDGTTGSDVFQDYIVWYSTTYTASNPDGDWEYVGPATQEYGSDDPKATIGNAQYIKYWDYSTTEYHFVAGSPVANFDYTATNGEIISATVTGLGGRLDHTTTVASTISPVFIANPVIVEKADYQNDVLFTFKSMQSKVRVGIYETIPGYEITSITFYNNAATPVGSQYITLNSATTNYFQGGSSVTGEIAYDWTTTPASYTFQYGTGLSSQKFWEGGQFTSGVPAINSAGAIADLYGSETNYDASGYFVVMPTPSATTAVPLTLTCDYTLTSIDNSAETINVTGATATIPAAYTKWLANTAYTYLFKITDNTNGTTGTPGTDPEGLYPITFDAAVVTFENNQVGTETTVSTPSITVYQDGDVVDNGITYVAGPVTITAMVGTNDVTESATWSYVELDGTTYDYTKDYELLGNVPATDPVNTTWTSGKPSTVTASKTYVIKAAYNDGTNDYTAYFVLVVGAAENGPAN